MIHDVSSHFSTWNTMAFSQVSIRRISSVSKFLRPLPTGFSPEAFPSLGSSGDPGGPPRGRMAPAVWRRFFVAALLAAPLAAPVTKPDGPVIFGGMEKVSAEHQLSFMRKPTEQPHVFGRILDGEQKERRRTFWSWTICLTNKLKRDTNIYAMK